MSLDYIYEITNEAFTERSRRKTVLSTHKPSSIMPKVYKFTYIAYLKAGRFARPIIQYTWQENASPSLESHHWLDQLGMHLYQSLRSGW